MKDRIMDDFIKEIIKEEKTEIPSKIDIQIIDTLNSINNQQSMQTLKIKKRSIRRSSKIVLIACLCIVISIGVAAAKIPTINNLVHVINPQIAKVLQDISITSESQGIKVEVLGAMNDNEMVVIYAALQDLTGNRIDETVDLYDFWLSGLRMFNSQIVDFNEETGVAILRIQANGGENLNGKMISFGINSFLSQKEIFREVELGIDPSSINNNPETITLDMNNIPGGGGDLYPMFRAKDSIDILKNDQLNLTIPGVDFMHISNVGIIDDRLHIQIKWSRDGVDDHGYIYFADSENEKIDVSSASISFSTDGSDTTVYGNDYNELIYELEDINLEDANLLGYFVRNNNFTEGRWRTTFRIQSVVEEKQQSCVIELEKWTINKVSISPMGLTLVGDGEYDKSIVTPIPPVKVNVTDGDVQLLESVMSWADDGNIRVKYTSSLPLDIDMVKSIIIDETVIKF